MTTNTTGEDRSVSGEQSHWEWWFAMTPQERLAHIATLRTTATPAPSTAAGEPALVCGCGWEGSYADLNETAEGMTCPKCRLSRNMDCAATPPAQRAKSHAHEKAQFKIWAEGKFEHIAEHMRWVTISIAEEGWMARAALAAQEGGAVQWACERWRAEVANRPLVNTHRRALDTTWRQVVRHFGGDDVALLGPCHDDLVSAQEGTGNG